MAASLQPIIDRHGGASWSATEYPTHASILAAEAAAEDYEVIVAIGGDGTLHEVVNGVMDLPPGQRPTIGAVPIGSGNDFSFNVGVQFEREKSMERIFEGQALPVDVGEIKDNTGRSEYWINTLGIGFDATVLIHTYQITRLQGFSMYLAAVLRTILHYHIAPYMAIQTDEEQFEQPALMIVICNGAREGGGFYVAPDAKVDDGILHYAMVGDVSRLKMFRLVPEVMNGTHGRFKDVRMGQFRKLTLTADRPLTIHTDGEVYAGLTSTVQSVDVGIHPAAIKMIV
jgi:YegS/Rv2252/BmrU family lipid kinase